MTQPASLWALRLLGIGLLALAVLAYEPTSPSAAHRLAIPVVMGAAAWLIVQNLVAVTLSGGILALIHSAPGNPDWVTGIAYPALAVICLGATLAVYGRRFATRIRETRDARWARRRPRGPDSET